MHANKSTWAGVLLWAVCLWLTGSGSSQAQTPLKNSGLGLAPALVDVSTRRGTTFSQTYTLENGTATRVRFRCSTGDFWYDANNQIVLGQSGTLPRSGALWTQFTPSEIIAEPHTSVVVKALITVPLEASGGYYLTPIFEAEAATPPGADPNEPNGKASLAVQMYSLLLLTVADAADYQIAIVGGQATPPTATAELSLKLNVVNRGTVHARVRGVFAILDTNGKVVGRGKTDEKTLLPEQRFNLPGSWAGELPPGSYINLVTLTYNRVGQPPATVVYEIPMQVKP